MMLTAVWTSLRQLVHSVSCADAGVVTLMARVRDVYPLLYSQPVVPHCSQDTAGSSAGLRTAQQTVHNHTRTS